MTAVAAPPRQKKHTEERIVWESDGILSFEQYLDTFNHRDGHIELVGGVPVERKAT
jgi:hypothetical protein